MSLFRWKRKPKEDVEMPENVAQDEKDAQVRITELEIEKNRLYEQLMKLREERLIDTTRADTTEALLIQRVTSAYRVILGRGWRRSRRDPAYALVRARVQAAAASEEGYEFEKLSMMDFEALIEDHPEHAARLRDIAYEFNVMLPERVKEEEPSPSEPPTPGRPEASA